MIDLAGDDPVSVGDVTDFTIGVADRDVSARAYVPDDEGPFPVVAFFHGEGFVLEASMPTTTCVAYSRSGLRVWLFRNADRFGGDSTRLAVAGDITRREASG